MGRRAVLTELGPDAEALREAGSRARCCSISVSTPLQVDACIRVADPGARGEACAPACRPAGVRARQSGDGRHRRRRARIACFISRVGRIEVFQPIPPPDGKSPEGPHTHVLPKLLRHQPHPCRDRAGARRIGALRASLSGASGQGCARALRCRSTRERHDALPGHAAAVRRSGRGRAQAAGDRRDRGRAASRRPSPCRTTASRAPASASRCASCGRRRRRSPALAAWLAAHDQAMPARRRSTTAEAMHG